MLNRQRKRQKEGENLGGRNQQLKKMSPLVAASSQWSQKRTLNDLKRFEWRQLNESLHRASVLQVS